MSYGQRGTGAKNLGALNAVSMLDVTNLNSVTVQLTGTWVGTVSFQASMDDGATYFSVSATPVDVDTAAVRTATANGVWYIDVTTYTNVQAKMTSYTSGTAVARINASQGRR